MRWISSPDWSDPTARRLHQLLGQALWKVDDLQSVWVEIGMDPATVDWGGSAHVLWPTLTREAARSHGLQRLVECVRERRPVLAGELNGVLTAELAEGSWYACPDPFSSHMVGPGHRLAVLDRHLLRRCIVNLAKYDYPVLSIRGEIGSGRSYSRRVLQHATHHSGVAAELIVVDAEQDLPHPAGAAELLRELAMKLGLTQRLEAVPPAEQADLRTESIRIARELVTVLVGLFRRLPPTRRWIFLDSLDRPYVQPDLHAAVGHLAGQIDAGQLGETRLIVTGHPGDFPQAVMEVLQEETISAIAEPEVRAFFRDVAQDIGRPLTESQLDDLVSQVSRTAPAGALPAIGRSAGQVAHEFFGGGR
ncbi:MAG: effector-associated domain EAD1-containing protein [Streptosporangiaceae bacterium]